MLIGRLVAGWRCARIGASGGLARTVELVAETFVNTHLLSVVCLRLFEVRIVRLDAPSFWMGPVLMMNHPLPWPSPARFVNPLHYFCAVHHHWQLDDSRLDGVRCTRGRVG